MSMLEFFKGKTLKIIMLENNSCTGKIVSEYNDFIEIKEKDKSRYIVKTAILEIIIDEKPKKDFKIITA